MTDKPTTLVFKDGKEMALKDFCIMFGAQFIWMDNIKYTVPESWKREYEPNNKSIHN